MLPLHRPTSQFSSPGPASSCRLEQPLCWSVSAPTSSHPAQRQVITQGGMSAALADVTGAHCFAWGRWWTCTSSPSRQPPRCGPKQPLGSCPPICLSMSGWPAGAGCSVIRFGICFGMVLEKATMSAKAPGRQTIPRAEIWTLYCLLQVWGGSYHLGIVTDATYTMNGIGKGQPEERLLVEIDLQRTRLQRSPTSDDQSQLAHRWR